MSTVSIAMATYNGARFLQEQLDSLAAQTLLPTELVITDDGSTDETTTIIAAFAKTAPFPVRLYLNESRLGWRANFMKAGQHAQSELIAFCDQDDIWNNDKINQCVSLLQDRSLTLVHHNADLIDEQGRPYGTLSANTHAVHCPRLSWNPLWHNPLGFTMVFRRRLLAFPEVWTNSLDKAVHTTPAAHDQWVYFLAGVFGDTLYVPAPLAGYRQHATNAVGWRRVSSGVLSELNATPDSALTLDVADDRLNALRTLSKIVTDEERGNIEQAASTLAEHTRFLHYSNSLYQKNTFKTRAAHYFELIQRGAYGPGSQWPLGRKRMLRDLLKVFFFQSNNAHIRCDS